MMNSISFPSAQQVFAAGSTNSNQSTTSFAPQKSFASVLQDSINQVNNQQVNADAMTNAFASGQNVDLSQVMISSQEANITMSTAVQIRNKVIDAYQQMMNMQV